MPRNSHKNSKHLYPSLILMGVASAIGSAYAFGGIAAGPVWLLIGLLALTSLPPTIFFAQWQKKSKIGPLQEASLAVSFMVGAFIAASLLEKLGVSGSALVYIVLVLLVTLHSRTGGFVALGTALSLSWGPFFLGETAASLNELIAQSAFLLVFSGLSTLVHSAEIFERRKRHQREVAEEKEGLLRQARELRLLSSQRTELELPQEAKAELIAREAVVAVNHAIYVTVSMLKTALNAHTVVLLWFDVKGEYLHIKELLSDSDHIIEHGIEPARGVIGGITRRREAVELQDLKAGFRGIPYYTEPQNITEFAGIPVVENGHLRGVLCVDRKTREPIGPDALKLMEDTAAYLVRAIENQRQFAAMERSKHELTRFFEASRKLNNVLTSEDVYKVALASADEIAPWEFAAISITSEKGAHQVSAIEARGPFEHLLRLKGMEFDEDTGLVSMVLKNRHYLPYGGVVRDSSVQLFSSFPPIEGLKSLLVIPLIAQDQTIGTLVVGHSQANHFSRERREMLEVVSNQVAPTLHNARLYEQMELMATTDGLTGLANHRSFQTRLDETIARHRRTGRGFAVILTDIDHFKSVNDTYGHPVGDEVLRQVSANFAGNLRETDLAARYGGEEFAMILEDTDLEAALMTANRLRTEIKKLVFDSDQGPFSITISMGVGYWPEDADHKQELIELTDQALYYSKQNGRDRVTAHQHMIRKAS